MPPHCALVGSLCASTDINVRCFCTTSFVYKTNHHLQSPGILVTKYSKNGELIKGPQRMILVIPKNAATDGQHCNGGTHILNAHPLSMVFGNGNIITQWCGREQCGTLSSRSLWYIMVVDARWWYTIPLHWDTLGVVGSSFHCS